MNIGKTIGMVAGFIGFILWTGFSHEVGRERGHEEAINGMRKIMIDDFIDKMKVDEDKEESKEVEPN